MYAKRFTEPPPRDARTQNVASNQGGGGGGPSGGYGRGASTGGGFRGGYHQNNNTTNMQTQNHMINSMPVRGGVMGGNMMRGGMPGMGGMGPMAMNGMAGAMNNFGAAAGMGFARGAGMIPMGPRGSIMGGGFPGRGGMLGGMGTICSSGSCIITIADKRLFFPSLGMGMIPTGPMGRGNFGGPMQGHFNPAFMQGQNGGGGQFGPDGPRKRFRMEQSG